MNGKNADQPGGGQERPENAHYRRYPEEEFIDKQEEVEARPGRAGAELAEHFGAVSGKSGGVAGRKE